MKRRDWTNSSDFVTIYLLFGFQENMFSFETEGDKFALKPMNCPGHW